MKRDLATISTELCVVATQLEQLRKNYLEERKELLKDLKEAFVKRQKALKQKEREFKSQISHNIVSAVLNPNKRPALDDTNFGFTLRDGNIEREIEEEFKKAK